MRPEDIPLPEKIQDLVILFLWAEDIIAKIWREYTDFINSSSRLPKTSLIFPIIFCELDFYDVLIARITARIPEELLREIKRD